MWAVCVSVSLCVSVCPSPPPFFSPVMANLAKLSSGQACKAKRAKLAKWPSSRPVERRFSTFSFSYIYIVIYLHSPPFILLTHFAQVWTLCSIFRFGPELQGVCLHIVFRHFLWCLLVVLLCCACGVLSLFMSFVSFLASFYTCVFFQVSSHLLHIFSCCATTFPILIDVGSCCALLVLFPFCLMFSVVLRVLPLRSTFALLVFHLFQLVLYMGCVAVQLLLC